MRITLVTGIFPPDIGGPASYIPRLAAALAERGHAVMVVTLSDSLDHDDSLYPFALRRILRSQSKRKRMPETARTIAEAARRSEVILANGLYIEASLAARLSHRPLVMKIVGDWAWERLAGSGRVTDTLDEFQVKRYDRRVAALKALRSWVTRRADLVFIPSQYLRRVVEGWGVNPRRLQVIYNALEPLPESPAATVPPFEGKTLVTAGRLVPWKGIDGILRVVRELPGVRLLIVGEGPLQQDLQELASSLQIDDRVVFAGRVRREQVDGYLRSGDVFILNSTYEGLPHVVLEAMQAGLPVVATDAGGTGEVVEHEVTGILVPPRDDQALRAAVTDLLKDNDKRLRLVEAARAMVTERFSWPRMVEETEELLRRAVGSAKEVSAREKPVGWGEET